MSRRFLGLAAAAVISIAACGGGADAPSDETKKPKLVLLVVVDQLRADYLTRFADLYEGGFRRLLDARCQLQLQMWKISMFSW